MGKGTDKLYITHSEWSNEHSEGGLAFGGAQRTTQVRFKRLPFYACALTLQPFKEPVTTHRGHVFDKKNILEWLKTHGHRHPITGESLSPDQLIPLTYHRNAEGAYHCPITLKEFTESSRIVAVGVGPGNVYSWEAIKELNLDPKHWRDLLNDTVAFTRKDLIELQNPQNVNHQKIDDFWYVKTNQTFENKDPIQSKMNVSGLADKVLKEMSETQFSGILGPQPGKGSIANKPPSEGVPGVTKVDTLKSTGRAAASFTSSSMDVQTKTEVIQLNEREVMYKQFCQEMMELRKSTQKGKVDMGHGYVQLKTNVGNLNLELYCVLAPQTCHNFIELCHSNYYNNTIFHRLIPDFMIQGGDPTGTGKGGKSYWGNDFPDEIRPSMTHNARGLLSMANRGKDTNSSQFFITFAPCTHLDGKHTIFGRVVGGSDVLNKMEQAETDSADRPVVSIRILSTTVYMDPFKKWQEARRDKDAKQAKLNVSRASLLAQEGTWLKDSRPTSDRKEGSPPQVGKYLKLDPSSSKLQSLFGPTKRKGDLQPESEARKKSRADAVASMSNFDNW